jgi:hypothetical protein
MSKLNSVTLVGLVAIAVHFAAVAHAEDCNSNGIPDELDLQPTLDFGVAVDYIAGVLPRSQAVGDLNDDGYADIVTGLFSLGKASVLINRGDGTYEFPECYAVGDRVRMVALGDIENDDDLDIFALSTDAKCIYFLYNNGSGQFNWLGTVNPLQPTDLVGLAVADLDGVNGDDHAMLYEDRICLRLNDGSGPFNTGDTILVGTSNYVIIAADLDEDTDADLIVADYDTASIAVLLNNGDATFQDPVTYGVGTQPAALDAADLDGVDGPDLAVANNGSDDVTVLFNNGNATFGSALTLPVGEQPRGIVAADLDGDTDRDLAVCNLSDADVSILLNDGGGGFAPATDYPAGRYAQAIAAVDVDLDDDDDLAVLSMIGVVTVLENDGAAEFPLAPYSLVLENGTIPVAAADLDGDEDPDVAVANYSTHVITILRNEGSSLSLVDSYAIGQAPFSIAYADFDDDEDIDLATANISSGDVSVLLNNGDATYASAVNYTIGTQAIGVVAVDLVGNELPDLAATYPGDLDPNGIPTTGVIQILENQGAGVFSIVASYDAGEGAAGIVADDFNGDLIPDLAVSNLESGDITVHLNIGDGTFADAVRYPFNTGLYDLTAGDFDNDDDVDIAAARYELMDFIDDGLGVFLNNGDGSFAPVEIHTAGGGALKLTNADLDDDGDLDLVLGNGLTDDIVIVPNLGDGVFGRAVNLLAASGATGVAVADFNADEKLDIVGAGLNEGVVAILENGFVPPFSEDCNGNDVPDECDIADGTSDDDNQNGIPDECDIPGDVDGDGDVDLNDLSALLGAYGACIDDPIYDPAADVDGDGDVDLNDLAELVGAYGTCEGQAGYNPAADIDGDDCVDLDDLAALVGVYGSAAADPVYDPAADFDDSGCVDLNDLADLIGNYGS